MPLLRSFGRGGVFRFRGRGRALLNGLTPAGAAPSAQYIIDNFPNSPSGVYWIEFPDGSKHQILCDMTAAGGGWMNVAKSFGSYSSALTSDWGSGGGDLLSGASSDSSQSLNGPIVNNSQAYSGLHCQGSQGASKIMVNQSIILDFSVSEVKINATLHSFNSVNCGYFFGSGIELDGGTITVLTGTRDTVSRCGNPRYDSVAQVGPIEYYASLGAYEGDVTVVTMYTACTGRSLRGSIENIWIR